ncbi:spore germination protein GerPC [Paenibacillus mendelii]|uniref:Spore germination protein GerPC n=1 Tax=Paenibacillus mendelii TaxID=206163 RepID=A0ABV6J7U3_9BACL|nr:spore germination protein GerPC [Paenibacillus mendelii]MCQ6560411.1 spore germination protein GerPC [Paenibacillus mendelii]
MQAPNVPPMTPWQMCINLSQQLHEQRMQLQEQQALFTKLCHQVDELSARLTAAESRPLYNIEKLEYQFDQLKVEKLDGTLNIGMTPPTEQQFKEFGQLVMPPGSSPVYSSPPPAGPFTNPPGAPNLFPSMGATTGADATQPPPPYGELRQEIDDYLNQTALNRMTQLESEMRLRLDPYHRRLVVEDIRKQMSGRIQYYMQTSTAGQPEDGPDILDSPQTKAEIVSKTKRDIDTALRSYLTRLREDGQ